MLYKQNLQEFFETELFDVFAKRQNLLPKNESIFQLNLPYVVGILVRFFKTEEFTRDFTATPLYDLRLNGNAGIPKIQGLADFCLFRTGIFPLDFNTKRVPPRRNFVMAGKSAYFDLSLRLKERSLLFHSLALNFVILANMISEVRLKNLPEQEILKLFEFWQESGNPLAGELLTKMGVSLTSLKTSQ
ncbi:MAG: hypothetical protein WC460_02715 [Patescibacteria group bacterium]